MLDKPVHELCQRADGIYRKSEPSEKAARSSSPAPAGSSAELGLALKSAAMRAGHLTALKEIAEVLRETAPEVAAQLDLWT
jgi:hypothetical protein